MVELSMNNFNFVKNTLLVMGATCCCDAAANLPSYHFMQASVVTGNYADIAPFTLKGLALEGNMELDTHWFLAGKYRASEDRDNANVFEEQSWQFDLGYRYLLGEYTFLDGRLGYGSVDFHLYNDRNSIDVGTHYFSGASNIRHQWTPNTEVYAGLEWQRWQQGSDQKAYRLGGVYRPTSVENVLVGVDYVKYSDSQWGKLFLRYAF